MLSLKWQEPGGVPPGRIGRITSWNLEESSCTGALLHVATPARKPRNNELLSQAGTHWLGSAEGTSTPASGRSVRPVAMEQ